MIEQTNGYKVGDKLFASLKDAQLNALTELFDLSVPSDSPNDSTGARILSRKDEVIAILTMSEPKERTRKPRSDRGKKHKAAMAPEPESPGVKVEGSGKYKDQ